MFNIITVYNYLRLLMELTWLPASSLKEACFNFQFPGVYLHLLEAANKKRIVYIGISKNVSERQYKYYSTYTDLNNLTDFSYYNIDLITKEPYEYMSNKSYEKAVKNHIIIQGGLENKPDIFTDEQIYSFRKKTAESIIVSAALIENLQSLKEVEYVLQKYLINKWKLDRYNNRCYPIGYTGTKPVISFEEITNAGLENICEDIAYKILQSEWI